MAVVINGTTGITSVNGSAAAPSVTGTDTDTGIVYGTNTLSLATGGTTAVTVDSSQNVGIGTTTPSYPLDVKGTSTGAITARVQNLSSNTAAQSELLLATDGANWRLRNTYSSASLSFINGSTEMVRIDSSGNLLVGATSQISLEKVGITFNGATQNGLVFKTTYATLGSSYELFYNSAGGLAGQISQSGTTAVTYATTSDYRLKENIAPMTGALSVVQALNPVTYTWKVDGSDGQGFIAHELQAVVPDCVIGEKDAVDADGNPKYQGIDTSFLVATLTAAIQELKAEFDAYKETHP